MAKRATNQSTQKQQEWDNNSKLTAIRFFNEFNFNRAVDVLFENHLDIQAVGFDVLLVPKRLLKRIKGVLHKSKIIFIEVPVVSTADLTEKERKELREEQKAADSLCNLTRKMLSEDQE